MRSLAGTVFVVAAALASACSSIDPAAKAAIDQRVAALQTSSTGFPPPAPGVYLPLPFAVGQWTQYKMIDDKGQPSFLTQKIVGQEGDAIWLESVTESYQGKTITKMLVAFGNRMDPSQVQIRAVKMKDKNGNVTEMPEFAISAMQSSYRTAVSSFVISWQGLPQENTMVPAGRFDGTFKARTDAQWGPWHTVADSWSHPAVPLSGAVRSQGVDHAFSMELVAFGTSGAVAEL